MSFNKGYPNENELVLNQPIFVASLPLSQLETDAYIGMPIGTSILTTNLAGSGDGGWIMKYTTYNENSSDWRLLSTGKTVGSTL